MKSITAFIKNAKLHFQLALLPPFSVEETQHLGRHLITSLRVSLSQYRDAQGNIMPYGIYREPDNYGHLAITINNDAPGRPGDTRYHPPGITCFVPLRDGIRNEAWISHSTFGLNISGRRVGFLRSEKDIPRMVDAIVEEYKAVLRKNSVDFDTLYHIVGTRSLGPACKAA